MCHLLLLKTDQSPPRCPTQKRILFCTICCFSLVMKLGIRESALNGCHRLADFRVSAQMAGPFVHTVEWPRMDSRNGVSRQNRSTLKKSFPKSIKNSSHNRFQKLDTSHFGVSEKKLLNLAIIIKTSQIYYRISCVKKHRVLKKHHLSQDLVVFFRYTEMRSVQLLESIVRRFFIDFGKLFFL